MKYKTLAETFERLSSTTSRLDKTSILAEFLKRIPEEDAEEAIMLLQGRAFPEWDERTVGLAGKLVVKAVARATGSETSTIEKRFKEKGDLGLVVEELLSNQRQQTLFSKELTVKDVYTTLQKIATLEGKNSQDQKLGTLNKLLTSASPKEAKFIVRTVLEDLRVGIAEGTIRDGTALAFFTESFSYDKKNNKLNHIMKKGIELENAKEEVKRALDLTADVSKVIKHIKEGKKLSEIRLQVGTPCKVMLARKEKTFGEAFERTGFPVRLEYKYDGFRLQIHKDGETVKLFTRRLEEVTVQFPDVVEAVKKHVDAKRCILDGEAVGYDPKEKRYKPFQYISQRIRRKYNIEQLVKDLPVEVNVFDVLLLEEKEILDKPLKERLEVVESIIKPKERVLVSARGVEVNKIEEAEKIYQEALDAGNEGVMIKNLDESYQPGGRVSAWIKMKPVMEELDLVIVKATWGEGKRSEWMTSFTLACRDGDEFLTVGKVGTGMKEEGNGEGLSFPELTEKLKPLVKRESGKEVEVKPEAIVTVAFEEIQKSTAYEAGYALRFPRTIAYRPDRSTEDIASRDEIIDFYHNQK
ncbi:MAG: ATP-dependent DNA ligase [Candidatus Woesearchaeota archaeon]